MWYKWLNNRTCLDNGKIFKWKLNDVISYICILVCQKTNHQILRHLTQRYWALQSTFIERALLCPIAVLSFWKKVTFVWRSKYSSSSQSQINLLSFLFKTSLLKISSQIVKQFSQNSYWDSGVFSLFIYLVY